MDLSRYMGGQFLKVADIQESGPVKVKIVEVTINKFKKVELTFDDGSVLSLSQTNTGRLGRHFGAESTDWVNQEVELYIGEIPYEGEMKDAILVKPISPPLETKKPATPQKRGNAGRDDLDDPIGI
jgi:hypothetical protein